MIVPQAAPSSSPRDDLTSRTGRRGSKRFGAARVGLVIAAAALVFTGCGTSGNDVPLGLDGDLDGASQFSEGKLSGGQAGGGTGVSNGVEAGAVTVTADPGHAVIEADGQTVDHTVGGPGSRFTCKMTDDQINLDIKSDVGGMSLTAQRTGDLWNGRFTADTEEEGWVQYSVDTFDGELGLDIDAGALSYEGAAFHIDREAKADGDHSQPTEEITLALNCGLDPATFEAGDTSLEFAPFASQSLDCTVNGPDDIDVTLNQLATDNRQFAVDMRADGDGAIGNMTIQDGDDNWTATISTNDESADGLEVDGDTVTYTGTFTHTSASGDEEEIEGTGTVTCPSSS